MWGTGGPAGLTAFQGLLLLLTLLFGVRLRAPNGVLPNGNKVPGA